MFFTIPALLDVILVLFVGSGVFSSDRMSYAAVDVVNMSFLVVFSTMGGAMNSIARVCAYYFSQYSVPLMLAAAVRRFTAAFLFSIVSSLCTAAIIISMHSVAWGVLAFFYTLTFSIFIIFMAGMFSCLRCAYYLLLRGLLAFFYTLTFSIFIIFMGGMFSCLRRSIYVVLYFRLTLCMCDFADEPHGCVFVQHALGRVRVSCPLCTLSPSPSILVAGMFFLLALSIGVGISFCSFTFRPDVGIFFSAQMLGYLCGLVLSTDLTQTHYTHINTHTTHTHIHTHIYIHT